MFDKMKDFVKEIGKYSFDAMNQKHQVSLKDNESILSMVTDVDLHNSRSFHEFLNKNFSDLNYIIIDEETIGELNGKLFEKIENSEYQFILDPIDGTVNYSSDLPFYGILLAVFRKGKPLYGFIYAPALDDFVYTDGKQVFREHFGRTELVDICHPSGSCVIQAHAWEFKLNLNNMKKKFIIQDYFSAAIYSLYVSLGQLKAAFSRANIWDIAPLIVIGQVCGIGIYDYTTGEEIKLSPKYISDNGRIKNMMMIGYKDEISEIKDIFSEIIIDS